MADSWRTPKPVVPIALAILAAADPDTLGSDEIPEPRPSRFYKVTRAGGDYTNPAYDSPRVLIECWATDSATAEQMALNATAAFKNARGKTFLNSFIHGCDDIQGPVDYNDPAIQDRRRCQFLATLLTSTD